jgi:hypothetical protein
METLHAITGRTEHKSQALSDSGIVIDEEHGLIRHRSPLLSRLLAN